MKAQSSVEFIMNYSWMLAIVGVVMAALLVLGFFNPGTWGFSSGESGFGNFAPMDGGWKVEENGTFLLKLRNDAGTDLKLWTVEAKLKDVTKTYNYGGAQIRSGEDSSLITIDGLSSLQKDDQYTIYVTAVYGTDDLNFTSQGKVWGIVGN
jgi:hypothetical protein